MTLNALISKLQSILLETDGTSRVDMIMMDKQGRNTIGKIKVIDVLRFPLDENIPIVVIWGEANEK